MGSQAELPSGSLERESYSETRVQLRSLAENPRSRRRGRTGGEGHSSVCQQKATESCTFYRNCLLGGYKHLRKHFFFLAHVAVIKD